MVLPTAPAAAAEKCKPERLPEELEDFRAL